MGNPVPYNQGCEGMFLSLTEAVRFHGYATLTHATLNPCLFTCCISLLRAGVGPWLVWLSGLSAGPQTKGSLV